METLFDDLTLRQLRQEFEFVSLLSLQHPDNPHWACLADKLEERIMAYEARLIHPLNFKQERGAK